ncbi:N-acetylmuramoyl-L-alanine amidase XlyA precursor [Peptococcaceae bacterium CEB3]|nr:N-acetylmuramoyl-L-alanine amidase XlyA precursor [Peptococcaceae bacterium CEB3]
MDYQHYVVQAGDTVYKIARAYSVSMSELIRLNNLRQPDRIYPGQVLLLPAAGEQPVPIAIPEPYFTYAAWLYEAYAGKDSELSAMTTYLYQAVVLDQPEFDGLLRPIAFEELNHLEQLGRMLRHLGVDPRYGSFHNGHWIDWRAKYLRYTNDLCTALDQNMEDEAKAHRGYLELCEKIPIPEIQTVLSHMAADEERHYQAFLAAKQQFCTPCEPTPIPEPVPEPEILAGPPEEGEAG